MQSPAVTLICLTDRPKHLAVFLACLAVQTREDWECLLLNQGAPADAPSDPRVRVKDVPRHGDWGQTEKMRAVADARGAWVGFPNDDAYYVPRYLELMLDHGRAKSAGLVYCDWACFEAYEASPAVGRVDVGGFLVKRSLMLEHGWPDRGWTGDGLLVESLAKRTRSARVPHILYCKN